MISDYSPEQASNGPCITFPLGRKLSRRMINVLLNVAKRGTTEEEQSSRVDNLVGGSLSFCPAAPKALIRVIALSNSRTLPACEYHNLQIREVNYLHSRSRSLIFWNGGWPKLLLPALKFTPARAV